MGIDSYQRAGGASRRAGGDIPQQFVWQKNALVTGGCLLAQVTMVERAAAERICKDPNPIIDGRKANVNLAYLGAKPRIQATELLGITPCFSFIGQWSFRKTGIIGTLASHTEIGVWIQARGGILLGYGNTRLYMENHTI